MKDTEDFGDVSKFAKPNFLSSLLTQTIKEKIRIPAVGLLAREGYEDIEDFFTEVEISEELRPIYRGLEGTWIAVTVQPDQRPFAVPEGYPHAYLWSYDDMLVIFFVTDKRILKILDFEW